MRIVVQRVSEARIEVEKRRIAAIGTGLLALVGVERGDGESEAAFMAEKIAHLRIFPDGEQRLNLSVKDIGGGVLSVSQFTLASHVRKGRRPDLANAEEPARAERLWRLFNDLLAGQGVPVACGEFGAVMEVSLVNSGPVTFILEKTGDEGSRSGRGA